MNAAAARIGELLCLRIEFQTTNEQHSRDDLAWSEVKQRNPISAQYRPGLDETRTVIGLPSIEALSSFRSFSIRRVLLRLQNDKHHSHVDRIFAISLDHSQLR